MHKTFYADSILVGLSRMHCIIDNKHFFWEIRNSTYTDGQKNTDADDFWWRLHLFHNFYAGTIVYWN